MTEMKELRREMGELARNSQQLLYDDGVFTRTQLTQAVARIADVVSKLCSSIVVFSEEASARVARDKELAVELGLTPRIIESLRHEQCKRRNPEFYGK